MDLNREVFENGMSWRRFQSLYRRLPSDSAFAAFIRDKSNRSQVDIGLEGRC